MSRTRINLVANFAGVGWSALMQVAFTPLYIKFMGIEAYGLLGFSVTLQGILQILDFGLSPTMNREMARYSVQPEKAAEVRDFVRTLEAGYWAIGIVIGAAVLAAAPFVASQWIKASDVQVNVVRQSVRIMGAVVALQWPVSFYQGGLMGLERQPLLNGIKIAMTTLSSGGAVLILWRISPTITAFFWWQVVASAIYVTMITRFLWRSLPPSRSAPRFHADLIRNVWRFAAGMSGITLTALILTQLDKVILSKLLSLEMFGYYTLASVVGNGLYLLIAPVFNAIFPRFSALAARGDGEALTSLYHKSTQLMAVLILPAASMVALFSYSILLLWTGSAPAAQNAAPIVSILVIGTALNGLMNLPYALQLAHGWTSIGLRINTLLIVILVPAILFATTRYGAVGAAAVWVVLNFIYMLIGVPLTHRRLLSGETRRWLMEDVGLPLAGAILVVWVGRELMTGPMPPIVTAAGLFAVWLGALAAATLAAPQVRSLALSQLSRMRMAYGARHRHGSE